MTYTVTNEDAFNKLMEITSDWRYRVAKVDWKKDQVHLYNVLTQDPIIWNMTTDYDRACVRIAGDIIKKTPSK